MARHQQQQHVRRQRGAGLAEGVQDQRFLALARAGAQQHRTGADMGAQRGARGQRRLRHHHVKLDAAGDGHIGHAQRTHAGRIGLGLRRHQRYATCRVDQQAAKARRLAQRALRQAGVGQHHRHLRAHALADQVGPYFRLHQDADAGLEMADETAHHAGHVIRQIGLHQPRAMPGEQRLAGGAAGRGHVGQHDAAGRILRQQRVDQRLGSARFTHRHGMHPDRQRRSAGGRKRTRRGYCGRTGRGSS